MDNKTKLSRKLLIPGERLAEFCSQRGIRKLSLFGSVLREDFGPDSDVDLLVEFEPGCTPGLGIVDLGEDLSRLFGDRKTDLVNPKYLNQRIKAHVLASAEVLFEKR